MIVIFAGPSLLKADRAILDATYLPPASQGDVYKAALAGATVIGIIDGYFDGVASVWHKEVLYALHSGIHVFGAASMGALRAAELHQFGMVGIGSVFQSFRDGILEDDDEVAVYHGDEASDYVSLSEAMVDVRAIVCEAVRSCVLPEDFAAEIIRAAKSLHYRDRRWDDILALSELTESARERFLLWLQTNNRSLKRADAVALLRNVAENRDALATPFSATFHFEATAMWYEFRSTIGNVSAPSSSDGGLTLEDILDEVRLARLADEVFRAALNRFMLVQEHGRAGLVVDRDAVQGAVDRFRRTHHLLRASDFEQWRSNNGLKDRRAIARFFNDQTRVYLAGDRLAGSEQPYIVDVLREWGLYGELSARAKTKQELVAQRRVQRTGEEMQAATEAALRWFEERNHGKRDFTDLGFPHHDALAAAVWKEYEYDSVNRHSA
jgi:hypothetical protein